MPGRACKRATQLSSGVSHQEDMKIAALIVTLMISAPSIAIAVESKCYGTTNNGRLEDSVKLPEEGHNYRAYSKLASIFRRTYVHSKVKAIILGAYEDLETSTPDIVYVFGETGWPSGGRFKPHKTHQNGLSVDFMVPLIDEAGKPVQIKTNALNKYGYNIEFDAEGKDGKTRIDYESMASHIYSLHLAALSYEANISRIYFHPELQKYLFDTKHGKYLKENIKFSTKPSWVRHDDHYHVDFDVKCKPNDG